MANAGQCIVCGRDLAPDGDPLVCDTCPRPATDDRALPPLPDDAGAVGSGFVGAPGRLPGMSRGVLRQNEHLALWETLGLGFLAASVAALLWYQAADALGGTAPIGAVGAGALIGVAYRFDTPPARRPLYGILSFTLTTLVIILTVYAIQRHRIDVMGNLDSGVDTDVFDLVRAAWEEQATVLVYWFIGVVVAARLPTLR